MILISGNAYFYTFNLVSCEINHFHPKYSHLYSLNLIKHRTNLRFNLSAKHNSKRQEVHRLSRHCKKLGLGSPCIAKEKLHLQSAKNFFISSWFDSVVHFEFICIDYAIH